MGGLYAAVCLLAGCLAGPDPDPGERWFVPRLSAVAHRECGAVSRFDPGGPIGCGAPPEPGSAAFERWQQAGRGLEALSGAERAPGDWHRLGRWWLGAWNRPEAVAAAIAALERALAARPGDAEVLADLAAAHLVEAAQTRDPLPLLAALEAAQRALGIDPQQPAARFNRALAREALLLIDEAGEDWRALAADDDAPWAAEASLRAAASRKATTDLPDLADAFQLGLRKGRWEPLARLAARDSHRFEREVIRRLPLWTNQELETFDRWLRESATGARNELVAASVAHASAAPGDESCEAPCDR